MEYCAEVSALLFWVHARFANHDNFEPSATVQISRNDGEHAAPNLKGLGRKKVGTFTITFKGKKTVQNEKEKEQIAPSAIQMLMKMAESHRSPLL